VPFFVGVGSGSLEQHNGKGSGGAGSGEHSSVAGSWGRVILSTAGVKCLLTSEHHHLARDVMCQPSVVGQHLAPLDGVTAMTDVTGFGLGGHLLELCRGSGLRAQVDTASLPVLDGVPFYIKSGSLPGGSQRNYASYGFDLSALDSDTQALVCDPQTSGGLLVAVDTQTVETFEQLLTHQGCPVHPIGRLLPAGDGPLVNFQ